MSTASFSSPPTSHSPLHPKLLFKLPCSSIISSIPSSFNYLPATPVLSSTNFRGRLHVNVDNSGRSHIGIAESANMFKEEAHCSTRDDDPIRERLVPQPCRPVPLVSALRSSARQDAASFHFPGHNRGRAAPSSLTDLIGIGPFLHDLPELPELDNLFSPSGPILEAQREASELFGSSETWFLVGGTTCGVQAAVMSTCSPGDVIVLPRNSHISAISAMVLSGAIPKYIIPEYSSQWDITGGISVQQVKKALDELAWEGRKASAVFLTSPTYHGLCSNIDQISKLCHSVGVPLIVDEAHGAHLGLHHELPPSALNQGADVSIQSTHKVLCSLTQSSMLHMSGNIVDRDRISRSLQILQSTSPSYLLLASLDAARAQLSENRESLFNKAIDLSLNTRMQIEEIHSITVLCPSNFCSCCSIDPLRLTVGFWQLGLSGYEADDVLYEDHEIVCELVENQSITFAMNLGTCEEHVRRLISAIKQLSLRSSTGKIKGKLRNGCHQLKPFVEINRRMSPREAFFARKKRVNIEECIGRISGELICPYPPGIPVVIPGEVITNSGLEYLLEAKRNGAAISGASDSGLSSIVVCCE
ncbi:hypothetical protein SAY87_009017 [Trapa incisa]|uniref:Arginine decarboxylase n=1 Tax=Trapa incisa TaxID=236973 RepID=A0AAN7JZ57_9MYRT|nr:hypothetical protein SAY87_009017 [Trapa incisa]